MLQPQSLDKLTKSFAVFGHIYTLGAGAEYLIASAFQSFSQFQRCLPAQLHNNAFGFFNFSDIRNIFQSEGFEIESVRDVIISGDCLWVRVDHYRFKAQVAQGEAGMDTAIVKFDALTDAVWTAS
ncbi:MAG: hypothetical protein BWY75_02334 [bacterium ADurb.Bin425]|nr:MAG: hypothetical protein BWY75_02334 [bacterium ADurb.Bin425]